MTIRAGEIVAGGPRPPPAGTRPASPTPSGWTWPARTPATSPSATASTTAWAPRSPGWRAGSPSARCSPGSRSCASTAPAEHARAHAGVAHEWLRRAPRAARRALARRPAPAVQRRLQRTVMDGAWPALTHGLPAACADAAAAVAVVGVLGEQPIGHAGLGHDQRDQGVHRCWSAGRGRRARTSCSLLRRQCMTGTSRALQHDEDRPNDRRRMRLRSDLPGGSRARRRPLARPRRQARPTRPRRRAPSSPPPARPDEDAVLLPADVIRQVKEDPSPC